MRSTLKFWSGISKTRLYFLQITFFLYLYLILVATLFWNFIDIFDTLNTILIILYTNFFGLLLATTWLFWDDGFGGWFFEIRRRIFNMTDTAGTCIFSLDTCSDFFCFRERRRFNLILLIFTCFCLDAGFFFHLSRGEVLTLPRTTYSYT